MKKKDYLALVNGSFNPENQDFKTSLQKLNVSLENHFLELGIIKLSSTNMVDDLEEIKKLPFIEHVELEGEMQIPPGEEE